MTVTVLRTVVGEAMGAQYFEDRLVAELLKVGELEVVDRTVTGLRSKLSATHRMPSTTLLRFPSSASRLFGAFAWPRQGLCHRMDLRLPPARNEVVSVHDLAPLFFDDEGLVPHAGLRSVRHAIGAVCLSDASAVGASTELGVARTWVVSPGIDEAFYSAPELSSEERDRLGLASYFVLHAGGATRRKGLELLARCWPEVHRAHPDVVLALVGPPHPRRDALFQNMPGTRLLGRQPRELLPRLMASATIVVVPSLYEGWGMPAAESMAAGTPVVACRTSSLPQVLGDAGVLVDADGDSLGGALLSLLDDSTWRRHLRAAGLLRAQQLTWANTVAAALQVYRQASDSI